MRPKYKTTGCARFFVFFILFVPAVFFGAAYFRGENGLQIIKEFFQKLIGGASSSSTSGDTKDTYRVEDLQKELKRANEEIQTLKQKVEEQQKEIDKLKSSGR